MNLEEFRHHWTFRGGYQVLLQVVVGVRTVMGKVADVLVRELEHPRE